eukprot:5956046-Amphidinium_carterae.3
MPIEISSSHSPRMLASSDNEPEDAHSLDEKRLEELLATHEMERESPQPDEVVLPATRAELASLEIPACEGSQSSSSSSASSPSDDEALQALLDDSFKKATVGCFALNPRSGCWQLLTCLFGQEKHDCLWSIRLQVDIFSDRPEAEEASVPCIGVAFPMVGLDVYVSPRSCRELALYKSCVG